MKERLGRQYLATADLLRAEAIERIDELVVAPIAAHLATLPAWRMLVCPDHPTFLATKTHSRGAVPYLLAGSGIEWAGGPYDEVAAAAAVARDPAARIEPGWTLMERFLDGSV